MPLPINMAITGFIGDLTRQAQARGWSLEELEQRAGLPAGYLGIVEALRRPPTRTAFAKLAHALDTSPQLLTPWLGSATLSAEKPHVIHELHDIVMLLEILPEEIRSRTIAALLTTTRLVCRQTAQVATAEAQADG